MLAKALGGPQRPETPPGVINLESPEPPTFAAGAEAGAPVAAKGAGETTARPPTSPARCALDMNTSPSTPGPMPSHQTVVMMPQAPWVLPPELAASPASPVAPPLNSSSSSNSTVTRARFRRQRPPTA